MFIGHLGVGLAGKKLAPSATLASLWFAALFADILWPLLVAVGVERFDIVRGGKANGQIELSFPWSHSLLMLIIWGVVFAACYRRLFPEGKRNSLVLGALVVSHWVLDWIVHRLDLPLWPGGPNVGFGLSASVPATMVVEIGLLAVGIVLYMRTTMARDRIGNWGFWIGLLIILGSYVASSLYPATPRSVRAFWIGATVANALILAWALWIEHHRYLTEEPDGTPAPRRVRVDLR